MSNFCSNFAADYAVMHAETNENKHTLTNLYAYEKRFIS